MLADTVHVRFAVLGAAMSFLFFTACGSDETPAPAATSAEKTAAVPAKKVPPQVALTGAPMPDGTLVNGLNQRCWFAEDWFDTPLSQ